MNRVLWRKAIADTWVQLASSSALLVLFGWIFVWLMNLLKMGTWSRILNILPRFVEPIAGVPLVNLTTPLGRLSFLFVHIITLLVCIGWAVGRGSDVVSGEISRSTMDLLASLPLRRAAVMFVSAVTTAFGSLVLVGSAWLGTWIGMIVVEPEWRMEVELARLWPGAINLAMMTFCLGGLTAVFSSWDRDRWRTIWLAGGLFAVSSLVKLIACLWKKGDWLRYFTFLAAFEPQRLILLPEDVARPLAWQYNGVLLGIGLTGYVIAAVVFTRRDIPTPY